MSLNYGIKPLLDMSNMVWLEPTLFILSLAWIIFSRDKWDFLALLLIVVSGIGSVIAYAFTFGGDNLITDYFRETVRLWLCIMSFWAVWDSLEKDFIYTVKALWWAVVFQCILAMILLLNGYGLVDVPIIGFIARAFYIDKALWIGNTAVIRMQGTFPEPAPFGLFMVSMGVAFMAAGKWVARNHINGLNRYISSGLVISFLFGIMSMADQALVAILMLVGGVALLRGIQKRKILMSACIVGLIAAASPYVIYRVVTKAQDSSVSGEKIMGNSGGERLFHFQNGVDLWSRNPKYWLTGIGAGQYGNHAGKSGLFPKTVTMQVTPGEWLVEYGLIGFSVIILWLLAIIRRSWWNLGGESLIMMVALVTANLFQANWKWEGWIVALAFMSLCPALPNSLGVSIHCAKRSLGGGEG